MDDRYVPFSPPSITEAEVTAVADALRSGWITTGPKTSEFERTFSSYLGAESALAVSSCTDALQVALAAIGVGAGDAAFVPTWTFCSTAHVVTHLGATPLFVDVDRSSLNISPESLRRAIVDCEANHPGLRPRVILPVHFAGVPCDMDAIMSIASEFGLAVVDDAAHALPAVHRGRYIGSRDTSGVTRASAFSFYATKNLTTGEGGMLTGSTALIREARLWSLHGMDHDAWRRYDRHGSWQYDVVRPGFKCNMSDIQAAVGLEQLRRLDDMQARRTEITGIYREELDDVAEVVLPEPEPAGTQSALHLFVVRLDLERLSIDRESFIHNLRSRGVGASVHFTPLHTLTYYQETYSLRETDFPVASREAPRVISLPLNAVMDHADAKHVADVVRAIVREYRA